MSYEINLNDLHSFVSSIGAETRERGDEINFKYCPKCSGGNNRDQWTFSLNKRSGAFCCQRSSCAYQGHFVELCRDFGYKLDFPDNRSYRKLQQPTEAIQPKKEAVMYLNSRAISQAVAECYEITVQKDNPSVLVFPFYDEQGILKFIKYRNTKYNGTGNKEWCERNTEPILFGMKQCKDFSRLVITEGQLDSLSCAEAGINNAVSVPTGANGFTWVSNCADFVKRFDEIVVFGDYEKGKITLVDGIRKHFNTKLIKVVRPEDYLGEKDANDILQKYGAEAVRKCVENAEVPIISNVKDLSTVSRIDFNSLDRIPTGFPTLDRCIGGLILGQLIVLSGKRGEGKSTFLSQLVCACLNDNRKVFVYSGELSDSHFKNWLDFQLAGKDNLTVFKDKYGDERASLSEETADKISAWYRGRAFIYDNTAVGDSYESITDTVEKVVRDYGVSVVAIDNLMTAMTEVRENDSLYLSQSIFVGKMKALAMAYNAVIILVAHTRKPTATGDINDEVSGASEITNKADVVLRYGTDETGNSTIQVSKNRLFGYRLTGTEAINVSYSPLSKRIWQEETSPIKYGWEADETIGDLPF